MTQLLYHSDSYLKEFEATIIKNDRELNAVILDRTAFYPGGGGQVPDAGFIRSGDIYLYTWCVPNMRLKAFCIFWSPGSPYQLKAAKSQEYLTGNGVIR